MPQKLETPLARSWFSVHVKVPYLSHIIVKWNTTDGENLANLDHNEPQQKYLNLTIQPIQLANQFSVSRLILAEWTYRRPTAACFLSDSHSSPIETKIAMNAMRIEPVSELTQPFPTYPTPNHFI